MNDYYADMFKIPFLHLEVRDWENKKQQLKKLFDTESYYTEEKDKVISDYHYKIDTGNIEQNNDDIDLILFEEIKIFKEFFQFVDHKIVINWFQTTLTGQHNVIHNHGSYGYSSVCYIDYDEKFHEPTKFIAPFNHFVRGDTLYFFPDNIREGSLVFFPSSINHYAQPNYSEVPRTILSINFNVRNEFGNKVQKIFDNLSS